MTMTEVRLDVRAIAEGVAAELGEGWTASKGYWESREDAHLHGPDGLRLHVRFNAYASKTQMAISDDLGELHQFKPYDAVSNNINVSIKKTPKQIAGDIKSRLLPKAALVFAATQERKRAHDEREARHAALAEEIRAAFGGDARVSQSARDPHEVTFGSWRSERVRAEVDPRGGTVTFKVEVHPELAALLAKAIGQL
ncbi:hypothetical protein [Lentzea sp. CC55]|uniref:hypothetical protein n=1 Tax=Lentzea sp. CC55 TaxID=2884909 RepID=UPI001F438A1A|nr:hypothetical protein [Lentzea sp. CC55]MCG8926632.1 hypothetical protein [Lentzea sp. CC55]